MLMSLVSCREDSYVIPLTKDNDVMNDEMYSPEVKIDQVKNGTVDVAQWVWNGDRLTDIRLSGNTEGTVKFSYAGDRVKEVVTTTDEQRRLVYTYSNNMLKRYSIFIDGDQKGTALVTRNSEDRISGANITFSGQYVIDMMQRFRNGDNTLISKYAMPQEFATLLDGMGATLDETASKETHNFKLVFNWYKGNVASEVLNGSVRLEIDPQRVVEDLSLLSAEMRMMVYSYLSSHNQLPVKVSFTDIATYTYDEMHNPYHGYLGDGLTAKCLSKNNILTATTKANMRIDILIGSLEIPLMNRNVNQESAYTYLYNDGGFPVHIAGDGLTVIDYCE